MAESENKTKEQESNLQDGELGNAEEAGEDVLSLESLDAVLGAEDPEFFRSLETIGPDDPSIAKIYEEGVELEYKYAEEKELWKNANGIKKLLKLFLPFLPYLAYLWKINSARFRLWKIKKIADLKELLKNAGPLLKEKTKSALASLSSGIGKGLSIFKSYSALRKVTFIFLIIFSIAGFYFVSMLVGGKAFKADESLFITSLQPWAQTVIPYTEETRWESFYSSTRIEQNVFLMQKMIVNLKKSENSEDNPMGAFEFFVEGTVNDVIVEIKDREPEIEDLFLRTIEEMNYDQISSGEGKKKLCEILRHEVNKILTKGQVRRIFFKTAIVKP